MNLKSGIKENIKTVLIVAAVLIVGMAVSVFMLQRYVQRSIHNERKIYLEAQTDTTKGLINELISEKIDYARVSRRVIETQGSGDRELADYMSDLQNELYMQNVHLILVDSNTIWYGEDGKTGRITMPQYYGNNSSAEMLYITTTSGAEAESIVIRERLQNPVYLKYNSGTIRIDYCAAVYSMEEMRKQVAVAFPYKCNAFLVDETGLMLYKDFRLTRLIDGTNLFAKYLKVEFKYGDTGQEQLDALHSGKTTVAEFTIPQGDFFICSAPLAYNSWYVSFIVSSDDLAAGSYIGGMFLFVGLIAILFSVGVIMVILLLIGSRQSTKLLQMEKEVNRHLEKASAAKGEFLSNMSHDIRTPINGIIGMTMIARKEDNPPKTVECLEKIDISSKYLLSLVNDVLDMSSIESGKFKIDPKPMDMKELLQDCMVIIHGQTQNRDLTLNPQFDEVIHSGVLADELRLRQVFINILGNAVKFTPDGGSITFRATEESADDEEVRFRFDISDTGCGMSEEFLSTIWERFSQEGESARTKYKGTGLGMAITKGLVELMGGEIGVQSKLNEGTTFTVTITLPRCENVPKKAEAALHTNIDGVRILLAEDNDINREIAVELLSDHGAIVDEAVDGKEALEKFSASEPGRYDIILMDIMMPVMNGKEATVAIRALERADAKNIPIVAMTANVMEADIKEAMAIGMDAYLTKPINLGQVLSTIARVTAGKKERSAES